MRRSFHTKRGQSTEHAARCILLYTFSPDCLQAQRRRNFSLRGYQSLRTETLTKRPNPDALVESNPTPEKKVLAVGIRGGSRSSRFCALTLRCSPPSNPPQWLVSKESCASTAGQEAIAAAGFAGFLV